MSRYVDADAVKGAFQDKYVIYDDTLEIIDSVPTADVVEVVRCKDCKHKEHCSIWMLAFGDIDFCSCGERGEG